MGAPLISLFPSWLVATDVAGAQWQMNTGQVWYPLLLLLPGGIWVLPIHLLGEEKAESTAQVSFWVSDTYTPNWKGKVGFGMNAVVPRSPLGVPGCLRRMETHGPCFPQGICMPARKGKEES